MSKKARNWILLNNCTITSGDYSKNDVPETQEKKRKCPTLEEIAELWTKGMKNEDGTSGPHWTLEETENVAKAHNLSYNKYSWYITMNMFYSDYYKVIQKFGLDTANFCCSMADAFLGDKDSVPSDKKVIEYYEHIVKH